MTVSNDFQIVCGDALTILQTLPAESVHCCVTSPPYWGLRDYGVDGQIGLERTPEAYVSKLVEVFREVRKVLREDGTLWLNLGDCYNAYNGGSGPSSLIDDPLNSRNEQRPKLESGFGLRDSGLKPKDLVGIPWLVAFALRSDGWYLRSDIIWCKPNPMPESVQDRCTKAHEYLFLLAKSERYYYNADAIREPYVATGEHRKTTKWCSGWASAGSHSAIEHAKAASHKGSKFDGGKKLKVHANVGRSERQDHPTGRNRRSVWTLSTSPTPEAHFATFPIDLAEICILAGCPEDGLILDPFSGAATTGLAALKQGRRYLGIELNPEYIGISYERARKHYPLLIAEAIA